MVQTWKKLSFSQQISMVSLWTGGTELALLNFTTTVQHRETINMLSVGLLIKVSDTSSHAVQIHTMSDLSIRGFCSKGFRSYFGIRKQIVKIRNDYSDMRETVRGVPQGSLLGPILFLIY